MCGKAKQICRGKNRAATGVLMLACGVARGVDVSWNNPVGGIFSDGSNWVGGTAPGAADAAVFQIGSGASYTVTLSNSPTVLSAVIHSDEVSLDLGARTFTSVGSSTVRSLIVGAV